ncbi:hypothetical protein NDU88_002850 [Pleurodeles waltl]|uniref:Uncharacterized protein n=1 Tax=Pleurodeles waltl TaxID=8319 RepID=A0AAV7VCD5_PLEWA|nr:hypothetical protein NDU88_002850 [Pleurodeles waltl]
MFIRLLRQLDSERDLLRVSGDARSKFPPLLDTASKGEERLGGNKDDEKAEDTGLEVVTQIIVSLLSVLTEGCNSVSLLLEQARFSALLEATFFRDEKVKKGNIWVAYS